MLRFFLNCCCLCVVIYSQAQPASEIFLFDVQLSKDNIIVQHGKNITNHKGYDNQPFFHPDRAQLYYTAADTAGRTDIFSYDYSTGSTSRVTKTIEREYSPTVTPDKQFISCILQRDNGAQDLCKYPIAGGPPVVLVNNLTIGYHAWMNENTVILFVLGEPLTLRKVTLNNMKDSVIAENIGRSIHHIPKTSAISFVQKATAGDWLIKKINSDGSIATIVATRPNREDLAWTPDGSLIMSDGPKLYSLRPGSNASWKEIELKTDIPLKNISRVSINEKGDKIALVVEE